MQGWQADKARADAYRPEIERIVRQMAGQIIEFRDATQEEDIHQATDYVIRMEAGEIGCRIRLDERPERDLTIRSTRPRSGNETELAKIKAGWGRWYLYGWGKNLALPEWIFVDLNALRLSGLMDTAKTKSNHDGSSDFIYIPWQQLCDARCLVDDPS